MGRPFIGEIRMFAGNFPPVGWELCEGQMIPISENDALFTLIGTTYGGDGQETFALPDLRGRIPLHWKVNVAEMGERAGTEEVTLTVANLPNHTHPMIGTTNGADQALPGNVAPARVTGTDIYGADSPYVAMAAQSVSPAGGSQPHSNMQPYLCVNFIISMYGIFPQPT